MEQNTLTNHDLALLLFSGERAGDSSAEEIRSAVQRTFEKLNRHLSRRLGSGGYQALLKRAVTLAAAEFPWLAGVSVTETGVLDGFDPASESQTLSETAAGCVAILASLIGLLETFIGRNLCLRALHTIWPDAAQWDKDGLQGDSNG